MLIKQNSIFILCFFLLLFLKQIKSITAHELSFNPYKHYEDKLDQWNIIRINDLSTKIFYSKTKEKYSNFMRTQKIIKLGKYITNSSLYKYRLSAKLLYFLTDRFKPKNATKNISEYSAPFEVQTSDRVILNNLSLIQYAPVHVQLKLIMKEQLKSVNILDVYSSKPEVIPTICSLLSIENNEMNCNIDYFSTNSVEKTIPLGFRIYPNHAGRYSYKIYIVVKVNNERTVLLTVDGQYFVNQHNFLHFYFQQDIEQITLDRQVNDMLSVKNLSDESLSIDSSRVTGKYVEYIMPEDFTDEIYEGSNFSIKQQKFFQEDKNLLKDLPQKEARPLIEYHFDLNVDNVKSKIKDSNLSRHSPISLVFKAVIDQKPYFIGKNLYMTQFNKLFTTESLNLGLMTSKGIWHQIPVYIKSKVYLPMYLQNVIVFSDQMDDFEILIATNYKYGIALPFEDKEILLFYLLVKYKGDKEYQQLQGKLKAELDIYNYKYNEIIEFNCFYYENMFKIYSDSDYNIINSQHKKVKVYIKNLTPTNLKLDKVSIIEDINYLQRVNVNLEKIKELRPLQEYHIATIDFSETIDKYKSKTAEYVFEFQFLENVFSTKIIFELHQIQCSTEQKNIKNFHFCQKEEKIILPPYPENQKEIKVFFQIKNTSIKNLNLKRIKFNNFINDFAAQVHTHYIQQYSIPYIDSIIKTKVLNISRAVFIYKPNLELQSSDLFQIEIKFSLPNKKNSPKKMHFKGNLEFEIEGNQSFKLLIEYTKLKGNFQLQPSKIVQNLIFPDFSGVISINAQSTFDDVVSIEMPQKTGNASNLIELQTFNRLVNPGLNENLLEFKLDPFFMNYPEENLMSQKIKTDEQVCLRDIDIYNNNKILFNRLQDKFNGEYEAEILVTNSLNQKQTINVQGTIQKGMIIQKPLEIEFFQNGKTQYYDLNLQNPFSKTMTLQLYLLPKELLNVDLIDKKIIKLIQKEEDPD